MDLGLGHLGLGHEPFMAVLELPKARIILLITAHSLSQPCLIAKAYVYQTVYLYTVYLSIHPSVHSLPPNMKYTPRDETLGGMYRIHSFWGQMWESHGEGASGYPFLPIFLFVHLFLHLLSFIQMADDRSCLFMSPFIH